MSRVVHRRHGLQSEGGASTRVGLGKWSPCVANPIAGFVEYVFIGMAWFAPAKAFISNPGCFLYS
jgi:hypothetical protein